MAVGEADRPADYGGGQAMMRLATEDEIGRWDALVRANPSGGDVLQCRAFAETKARHGWKPRYALVEAEGREVAALVLSRTVWGLGELWYLPGGPGVASTQGLADFAKAWQASRAAGAVLEGVFLVKIEPEFVGTAKEVAKAGFTKAPRDIQYNVNTVVVDLAPSEDEIINSFKQKTRYNIRLAERKGVKVEAVAANETNIEIMYGLMQATQKRAGFFLRPREYFADFWRLHDEGDTGQMFFASFEGKVLAGDFATYLGSKALYKDGGSIREHSELQSPYYLQWEVMRWLKSHGVTRYDLHGTPPADQIENPNHPLAGLARFKTGFNPEITSYIGAWDLALDARKYQMWLKFGERVATSYEFKLRKRLFY